MNARGRAKRNVWKDTKAVSPVVAVLILIVVAVIGGIAVGAIQTGILRSTGEKASVPEDVGVTEIDIIGGPGVTPVMVGYLGPGESMTSYEAPEGTLLHEFAAEYPNTKVTFLRECCGFAMYALSQDVCDMGMGRRFPTTEELAAYPDLKVHLVAKAPLAVIANTTFATTATNIFTANCTNYTMLNETFLNTTFMDENNVTPVVYHTGAIEEPEEGYMTGGLTPAGEVYGTSDQGMFSLYLMQGPSASDWILGGAEDNVVLYDAINENSDNYTIKDTPEEVIEFVANNNGAIGFVPYRYAVAAMEEAAEAEKDPGFVILGLDGITEPATTFDEADGQITEIGRNDAYVTGLGGPMFTPVVFFTLGDPSPAEQALIDYCRSFRGHEILKEYGFLAGEDIVVAATCPFHVG